MSAAEARLGRADLHIHTLASDGVSSVAEVLDQAVRRGLDVIAIGDHERVGHDEVRLEDRPEHPR